MARARDRVMVAMSRAGPIGDRGANAVWNVAADNSSERERANGAIAMERRKWLGLVIRTLVKVS